MSISVSQTKRGTRIHLKGSDANDFLKLMCTEPAERDALQLFKGDVPDEAKISAGMMDKLIERGLVEPANPGWYRLSDLGKKLVHGQTSDRQAGAET